MTTTSNKQKDKVQTVTFCKIKINTDYFNRLMEFYKLPWYKKLFKKIPKE